MRTSREELVTPPRNKQMIKHYESRPANSESPPTLIGTGIFEQNDLAFLKMQASLLSQEQIGTLDNVLEVGFAVGVNKRSHVRNVDSFRSKE